MDRSGTQVWTWTLLCVFLSWMSVTTAVSGPYYTVTIPAVLEARANTFVCVVLMNPNETLTMNVTLRSQEQNLTLFEETSFSDFKKCIPFQVPAGENEVAQLEADVQGQTFHSKDVKKVLIKSYKPVVLIQTDKPTYLPGQTVNFRVVSLDSQMKLAIQLFDKIQIEDPNGNKIGQWLNESSQGIILEHSYKLNSEAREGTYRIMLHIGEDITQNNFKVEHYVLPKFEVKINATDEISVRQEEIEAEICAKYSFGQSVPGSIKAEMCRPLSLYRSIDVEDFSPPCLEEIKPADKFGCAHFIFKKSIFFDLDQKFLQDSLKLTAQVEEEGTEITHKDEKEIKISFVVAKLSFGDTPKTYEKEKEIEGQVKAVHYNNTPISDMLLYLYEGNRWNSHFIQQLTTDSEGVAAFRYTPAESKAELSLYISDKQIVEGHVYIYREALVETASHTLVLVQDSSPDSITASSLEVQTKDHPIPCGKEEHITIKYTIVGETKGSAAVSYVALSRGAIVDSGFGEIEVQDQPVTEGQMSFELTVSPEMAPLIQFVVYAVLPSETVIASRADFSTEKCFSQQVSLEFAKSSCVPAEDNTLKVTAHRDALCGVSIVDRSVVIMEPEKTLNADTIFSMLPVTKLSYTPYELQDPFECLVVRPKRHLMPSADGKDDPFTVFKDVGLKMATNLHIRAPTCLKYGGRKYYQGHGEVGYSQTIMKETGPNQWANSAGPLPIETVRTFFPETMLWSLVETGASGTTDIPITVPDTITTWETEAFCLSPQGFGLAPREELTVFQPFFLELSLPYSIVRGENFELKATVFNYLSSCLMISVKPSASNEYSLDKIPEVEYETCLCGNERKTFKWIMTPTALGDVEVSVSAEAEASHRTCTNEVVFVPERGRIDIVTRILKVKAEGVEKKKTTNWLLCPKDQVMTEETVIPLPDNVIEGSSRVLVSVVGDIMGRALHSLDGLLQMPFGCGEQNMALLAPNIYVLQYLRNTNQLTPAIKEKGENHLTAGYQRQLNYKTLDGAFSTFGSSPGNTWLTAFVVRAFSKAQDFIYIDQLVIDEAKKWLDEKQKPNGCYTQEGKLFNNAIKGGVSDEVTISAYVTAAILESNSTVTNSVSKSLSCLKNSHNDLSNTYATALQAYVFALAGDIETRNNLLKHLDSVAINDGGFIHWSQASTPSSSSLSVETSSYVLLALLTGSTSAEELGNANNIVRWLTSQQNYYGGFSSTQDTVVALQALALYSTHVSTAAGSGSVRVQSPSSQLDFTLTPENKLIYQEQILNNVSGKYKVEAEGTACASVQISHHYNVPPPTVDTTLSVLAAVKAQCNSSTVVSSMTLTVTSLYTGENSSNMVILDIKMLSGFVPDSESLKLLKSSALVERVDHNEDHILVYIKELKKDEPVSYELDLKQELPVSDLKPAVIKIYDYYQPEEEDQTEYNSPCDAA